jgi:serine/threonine protein kinase
MQTVNQPNVVRLFEPLYSETLIYLVLDFCDTDLKKYMSAPLGRGLPSRAPLSEEEAKPLMRDFAAGLLALREQSIIHRDLKDENLLIAKAPDGRKVLKIADFGFAKKLVDLAATTTEVGSPAYMAPEVFATHSPVMREAFVGRPAGYDAKADLWGVGCILYGVLCKGLVFSDAVRTKEDLVNELAREMRDGVQKSLPTNVEFEHGRVFDGPASQYNQAAEESAASRRCKQELAAEAGVPEGRVCIIGARNPDRNPTLKAQGKVIVKYRRDVVVSADCNDLLRRLLQHHPDDRIEWDDFFAHPWLQPAP